MEALRKQNEEQIQKILTEEQQKQFETMKGAPFTLQFEQRRRRSNNSDE